MRSSISVDSDARSDGAADPVAEAGSDQASQQGQLNATAIARKRVGVRRTFTLVLSIGLASIAAAALFACASSSPTTGITPITGVVIRSESLIVGHGCGRAPAQVFKYLAVVSNVDPSFPQGGSPPRSYAQVFDCFADGVFVNLIAAPSGSLSFNVDIFLYDADDYSAHSSEIQAIQQAAPQINPDSGTIPNPPPSTWTTTCTAKQQQNVVVLAVCRPLTGGPATRDAGSDTGAPELDAGAPQLDAGAAAQVRLPTLAFARADGGAFTCGADYVTTRAFYKGGVAIGQTGSTPCPQALVISPALPNVTYTLDVTLEKNGAAVAQPVCTAMTLPGQTVTATCAPAP